MAPASVSGPGNTGAFSQQELAQLCGSRQEIRDSVMRLTEELTSFHAMVEEMPKPDQLATLTGDDTTAQEHIQSVRDKLDNIQANLQDAEEAIDGEEGATAVHQDVLKLLSWALFAAFQKLSTWKGEFKLSSREEKRWQTWSKQITKSVTGVEEAIVEAEMRLRAVLEQNMGAVAAAAFPSEEDVQSTEQAGATEAGTAAKDLATALVHFKTLPLGSPGDAARLRCCVWSVTPLFRKLEAAAAGAREEQQVSEVSEERAAMGQLGPSGANAMWELTNQYLEVLVQSARLIATHATGPKCKALLFGEQWASEPMSQAKCQMRALCRTFAWDKVGYMVELMFGSSAGSDAASSEERVSEHKNVLNHAHARINAEFGEVAKRRGNLPQQATSRGDEEWRESRQWKAREQQWKETQPAAAHHAADCMRSHARRASSFWKEAMHRFDEERLPEHDLIRAQLRAQVAEAMLESPATRMLAQIYLLGAMRLWATTFPMTDLRLQREYQQTWSAYIGRVKDLLVRPATGVQSDSLELVVFESREMASVSGEVQRLEDLNEILRLTKDVSLVAHDVLDTAPFNAEIASLLQRNALDRATHRGATANSLGLTVASAATTRGLAMYGGLQVTCPVFWGVATVASVVAVGYGVYSTVAGQNTEGTMVVIEELLKRLNLARDAASERQASRFLELLAVPLEGCSKQLDGKQILEYPHSLDEPIANIRGTLHLLLQHGLEPKSIAFLFTQIAEALTSNQIKTMMIGGKPCIPKLDMMRAQADKILMLVERGGTDGNLKEGDEVRLPDYKSGKLTSLSPAQVLLEDGRVVGGGCVRPLGPLRRKAMEIDAERGRRVQMDELRGEIQVEIEPQDNLEVLEGWLSQELVAQTDLPKGLNAKTTNVKSGMRVCKLTILPRGGADPVIRKPTSRAELGRLVSRRTCSRAILHFASEARQLRQKLSAHVQAFWLSIGFRGVEVREADHKHEDELDGVINIAKINRAILALGRAESSSDGNTVEAERLLREVIGEQKEDQLLQDDLKLRIDALKDFFEIYSGRPLELEPDIAGLAPLTTYRYLTISCKCQVETIEEWSCYCRSVLIDGQLEGAFKASHGMTMNRVRKLDAADERLSGRIPKADVKPELEQLRAAHKADRVIVWQSGSATWTGASTETVPGGSGVTVHLFKDGNCWLALEPLHDAKEVCERFRRDDTSQVKVEPNVVEALEREASRFEGYTRPHELEVLLLDTIATIYRVQKVPHVQKDARVLLRYLRLLDSLDRHEEITGAVLHDTDMLLAFRAEFLLFCLWKGYAFLRQDRVHSAEPYVTIVLCQGSQRDQYLQDWAERIALAIERRKTRAEDHECYGAPEKPEESVSAVGKQVQGEVPEEPAKPVDDETNNGKQQKAKRDWAPRSAMKIRENNKASLEPPESTPGQQRATIFGTLTARREKKVVNVLSVDGGGIRGTIPAVLLSELEARTHTPICKTFEMMAGSSTGALLVSALAVPKAERSSEPRLSALELVKVYAIEGPDIFRKRSVVEMHKSFFDESGLERKLAETFTTSSGRFLQLGESLSDLLIPVVSGQALELLHTHHCKETRSEVKLYDVVRGAVAAPTLFPPHKLEGWTVIDGALKLNNPSVKAFSRAQTLHKDSRINMLSLGCGRFPCCNDVERTSLQWCLGPGAAGAMAQMCDTTEDVHHIMLELCGSPHRYTRCDPVLVEPIGPDAVTGTSIAALLSAAETFLENAYASESNWWNRLIEQLSP